MTERPLLELAIEGHGGLDRWNAADEIAVRVSSGGFAFASKFQGRAVRDAEVRVATDGQRTVISPYPAAGKRGVFDRGKVRIETDDGRIVAARDDPRPAFRDLRHLLWWDRLDILYFGGFALWTYLSLPFVLSRPGYATRELPPWREGAEGWRRLAVAFPADVHTHCREQVLYFDALGRLRRHDYTAEPFGGWAKAAHYCMDHRELDGIVVPTRRRVFPRRRNNRPLPHPVLVWIELEGAARR